jgi:hypothetical protein
MSQLANRRNLKDAELIVSKALPAANANNNTDSIEIGGAGPHRERLKLRATIPTNAALVATKTLTLTLQDSADDSSFAAVSPGQAAAVVGKGGNGIDATWNDNNEFRLEDDAARCAAGEAGDLRPTLTLLMNHASRAAQRDARPEHRDFQVTRSGGLGMQRYAQTWSGDNLTSWRTLAYNLPMGLSLSLCGWASHGHDVGGFAGPPPDAELLTRWVYTDGSSAIPTPGGAR